jgi:hypothetical protein
MLIEMMQDYGRRRSIQYLAHLHMSPLPTVSGGYLPSCPAIALRLVKPAAWMSRMIGRTLAANCAACALRVTRMRSTAPAGSGVPSRFPRCLGGRQSRLGALRDRLALVFGNGRPPAAKAIDVYSLHSDAAAAASLACR